MTTRALNYPDVRVVNDTDHLEVEIVLTIPGSRLGPVVVTMTYADADSLAADLLEACRG